MSQSAKQLIIILVVLLLASLGAAGYFVFEKQKVDDQKASLENQVKDLKSKEKQLNEQIQKFKNDLGQAEEAKGQLQKRVEKAEKDSQDIKVQVGSLTEERNSWQKRFNLLDQDYKDLNQKFSKYKEEVAAQQAAAPQAKSQEVQEVKTMPDGSAETAVAVVDPAETAPLPGVVDEDYWASLLKEKASLEVKIDNLNQQLNKSSMEVVDIKQKNADLQIALENIKNAKDQLQEQIKYKEDMLNNLSLDLARTKNDKKFVSERAAKFNDENVELRKQLKQLVSAKTAVEKSYVRLTEEKNKIEKKLIETEGMIQNKIDEIWEMKEGLGETLKEHETHIPSSDIELSPIVVNSQGSASMIKPTTTGLNGKIVSINDDNNFVIVDLGEKTGIRVGDSLSVYRNNQYIARLEVIQVRKDISAADIKDRVSKIKVGDTIR